MSRDKDDSKPRFPNWVFTVVGIFFFFTLIGSISTLMPTIYNDLQSFFQNFTMATVPNTGMLLPAPSTPGLHTNVYTAGAMFCLGWGFYAIAMLVVRIIARSPPWKTAEEFSSMVWWFGSWFLLTQFLTVASTVTTWFLFWAAILMLIGGSVIVRAIILVIIR